MYLKRSKIVLAQIDTVLGDISRNVIRHVEFARRAIEMGADAIVFPELSLTGYTLRDLNNEVAIDPNDAPVLEALLSLSTQIVIICGGVERAKNGGVHNSAFVFEGGVCTHVHRKIYPPTYGIFEEERYFLAGTNALAFDSAKLGRVGILICEDLWHPSLPYMLAYQGAQLIVTIAASPTRLAIGENAKSETPVNYDINNQHHMSYSRLFGVYTAFVNRIVVEDGVNFWGGSECISPNGDVIKRAVFFDEDLLLVDVDPNSVIHAREYSRHMLDENLLLTQQMLVETISVSRS